MMQTIIPAQVVNGHLRHEQSLKELEGERVMATLTIVPKQSEDGVGEKPLPQVPDVEFDPKPPPWLEVEHDFYFPMKVPEILLEKKPLTTERGTPSFILPEELPEVVLRRK